MGISTCLDLITVQTEMRITMQLILRWLELRRSHSSCCSVGLRVSVEKCQYHRFIALCQGPCNNTFKEILIGNTERYQSSRLLGIY